MFKCVNAGLPCPGLGPRIRFVHGIASRGKFKNKPAPLAAGIPDDPPVDPQPESREEPRPSQTQCNPESQLVVLAPWRPQLTIYYPLDHMSGCERSLLHYYAEKVAPIMVPINKPFNGYRDVILPMTETCPTMLNAALAAASHHLAVVHQPTYRQSAASYYTAAIRGLRLQQQQSLIGGEEALVPSRHTAVETIGTILLLLVCDMVAAGSDFQILFRMLTRLVEMSGGSDALCADGDLNNVFLIQQVKKLSFYGQPFLREATETSLVVTGFAGAVESFTAQSRNNPEHAPVFARLIALIEQAHDIYIHRALGDLPPQAMNALVERFLDTAGDIPVASPGGHSLVWAYFIVAAESSDPRHRRFFVGKLRELFNDTGFANALSAIQELQRIWSIAGEERWTYMLPTLARTLVM
ncbi:C6 zinc finger domain containing protein [Lasiodiplodia theobromae]|uniref:C6 zinc finger domain containing protein n=1 Tax=Lasiodiplodia theobromae TaxID=45133 RepID=UPI0015C4079A|nr:C6 zinc finger domain containing protein [Lasiodiplodia theobromae]KAF4535289.1 C6 zinc finger domain containing protein [Lasiodiplodia theobromae]